MFSESTRFPKIIVNFLIRFPAILLSDQIASTKLQEVQQENGRFLYQNVLVSEYTDFTSVILLFEFQVKGSNLCNQRDDK